MSEKVLGVIWVMRLRARDLGRWLMEVLVITSNRVFVMKAGKSHRGVAGWSYTSAFDVLMAGVFSLSEEYETRKKLRKSEKLLETITDLEEFLKADKHNFAIPNSEITKVELKKGWTGVKLNITTNKKKFKWYAKSLGLSSPSPSTTAPEHGVKLEDFENILQRIFPDKMSVKK